LLSEKIGVLLKQEGNSMAGKDKVKVINKGGGPPAFAFLLAYFGALVYFIDNASGFWEVVFAFLQALVWPALLINKIFTILQI
jgi:hypothetical protein